MRHVVPLDDNEVAMSKKTWMFEDLYFQKPAVEYRLAFDVANSIINKNSRSNLAVISSSLHATEIVKRCRFDLDIVGTGSFTVEQFVDIASDWSPMRINAVKLKEMPKFTRRTYSSIIWAEPEVDSSEEVANLLRRSSLVGTSLMVVTTTRLRHFLPVWRSALRPAHNPLSPGATMRSLAKVGWRVDGWQAFHTPQSVFWAGLSRLASIANRPDWRDRCFFAMRAAYRKSNKGYRLTPVVLLSARAI